MPTALRYVVTDGFYSKFKWIKGVTDLELEAIGKLRRDADLRFPYQGEYSGRGRPRKYSGKVDLTDYSNFELVTQLTDDVELYTSVVWSMSLKRQIRLVYLLQKINSNSISYVLLFSTDLELDAYSLYLYYKARFQIEFLLFNPQKKEFQFQFLLFSCSELPPRIKKAQLNGKKNQAQPNLKKKKLNKQKPVTTQELVKIFL